jgi:predicted kinase
MTNKEFVRVFSKLTKPYILILIGPPLSGKDSLLKQLDLSDTTVISRDDILMEMSDTDDYSDAFNTVSQKEVDAELQRRLFDAADNGKNAIINMTNMTSKRRRHNLEYFGDEFTKIAVIFPILEWDEYKRRNDKRKSQENKWIPEHVIKRMIGTYQPIRDEEGFDKVVSLENNDKK